MAGKTLREKISLTPDEIDVYARGGVLCGLGDLNATARIAVETAIKEQLIKFLQALEQVKPLGEERIKELLGLSKGFKYDFMESFIKVSQADRDYAIDQIKKLIGGD